MSSWLHIYAYIWVVIHFIEVQYVLKFHRFKIAAYLQLSIQLKHIIVYIVIIKLRTINSLHAMGTFMCLYKIEKTMYFILTSNIKSPYKFT